MKILDGTIREYRYFGLILVVIVSDNMILQAIVKKN